MTAKLNISASGAFVIILGMTHFGPFLLFDGNCAEAMRFYQACFGGELSLTTVGDSPMKDRFPVEQHGKVVHAQLKSDAVIFSGTDWLHPTRQRRPGNTVCLYISEVSYDELQAYFTKLSEGAAKDLLDPLVEQPFGYYGALTDKYGFRWMFEGSKPTANSSPPPVLPS